MTPLPPEAPPLLALVMMVKNEADFINQTLASVKPHIDSWTIVDTGGRRRLFRYQDRKLGQGPGSW